MFPDIIHIPKRLPPPRYHFGHEFDINAAVDMPVVLLFRTPYIFLYRISGVPVRMERWMNAKGEYEVAWIAEGYRCQECQRILFSPDLDGFSHECNEDNVEA